MKFGRVEDPGLVQHCMPTHTEVGSWLRSLTYEADRSWGVFMGAPAWGDTGFLGKIYPERARPADYLHHYALHFGSIELNATYYRIPSDETVEKWTDATPDDFLFCPKFPQQISNHRSLQPGSSLLDSFLRCAFKFGDKLGTTFLQLPMHFSNGGLEVLKAFVQNLPQDLPLAVEFRHPGWFMNGALIPEALEMLAENRIGGVITDTSGRRDVLHLGITGRDVLIRFTGNRLHATDFTRLDNWVRQLDQWQRLPVKRIFFMIHQPEEHWCVDTAQYFAEKLQKITGISAKAPTPIQGQLNMFR